MRLTKETRSVPDSAASPTVLAERLQQAWEARTPIEPFSASGELLTVEQAYATQRAWARIRSEAGEQTIGRKIGLTSPGMQRQMGVNEPDFGDLWASRCFTAHHGRAEAPLDAFIQPRVEGELAFLMESELMGPGVTEADVLDAASAAAPGIEIIDSRIVDWRIKLLDTIADNASYGGFVLGEWSERLLHADLRETTLEVSHGRDVLVLERGTAVLGSPLTAVSWLANKLGSFGVSIRKGDVVLSGSFGAAAPVGPGVFQVMVPGYEPVQLTFS
jgi:2-keto-4-pentenoate hydratase